MKLSWNIVIKITAYCNNGSLKRRDNTVFGSHKKSNGSVVIM